MSGKRPIKPDEPAQVLVVSVDRDHVETLKEIVEPYGIVVGVFNYKRHSTYAEKMMALAFRDGRRCSICGFDIDFSTQVGFFRPTFDHVYPLALGGDGELDNLKLAHALCNKAKGCDPDWVPALHNGNLTWEEFESIVTSWSRPHKHARSVLSGRTEREKSSSFKQDTPATTTTSATTPSGSGIQCFSGNGIRTQILND